MKQVFALTVVLAIAVGVGVGVGGGGCASPLPAMPSQGGPAWLEVSTPHFTIWTDADLARGRELAREVEQLRQVVIGTAFRGAAGDGRAFVIAFRDDNELHVYVPSQFSALTIHANSNALRQPEILMTASPRDEDARRLSAHELTHVISYAIIHEQPHWFAEGLAMYYETIHVDASSGEVDLGEAPTRRGQPMRLHHLVPLATLFACKQLTCMDAGHYATAWALYTYLSNVRPDDLAKLEVQLEADHGDGDRAWTEVFGANSQDVIEGAMRQWLIAGSHTVLHFKVALVEPPVAVRTLAEADVYALRAFLRQPIVNAADDVAANLRASLALEATNVLALVVTYARDHRVDPAAARAAAAAHPGDWHAWWLVAVSSPPGSADAEAARTKACGLAATDPAIVVPRGLCATAAPPR